MVASTDHHSLEVDTLKLTKEQFPLPISLQPLVQQDFASQGTSAQDGAPMPREDLFAYLRAIDNFELSPLQAVLAQTEIIGEPALPSEADGAALAWIGAAFDHWEQQFPLDKTLAASLRRFKPLLSLMALVDNQFYSPGVHPLHHVLDSLYDAAVGWQEGLGRAGEPMQKLIDQTLENANACLDDNGAGLMALLRDSAKSAQRIQTRTRRMAQRTADAERGQLRAARAKLAAANMINEQITRHPIPSDIGDFLTGPWFESAQLVLLKYGSDSSQWREVTAVTTQLMDTLAPGEENAPAPESSSQVMQGVKHWLLSLQHDQQLTDEVVSTIEYTHLRVARGVNVERAATALIPVKDDSTANDPGSVPEGVDTGQWFQVDARKGGKLRIQLAMMQSDQQRLLFCNHAGAKVQSMDYASFAELLRQGKASPLDTGASFSRSLAAVTGIDTQASLAELTGEPMPADTGQDEPSLNFKSAEPPPASAPTPAPPPPPGDAEAAMAEELPPLKVGSEPNPEPDLPESGIPELPMGTWLGFHDLDPPLLAKLALHDKVRRLIIFVNRKGIELRRLSEDEYLGLLQEGLVDILETKTNFREQVERARQRMAKHQ